MMSNARNPFLRLAAGGLAAAATALLPVAATAAPAPLWHYTFDEAASGTTAALDTGSGVPANGTFVGAATRVANTPGGISTAALDVNGTAGSSHYLSGGDADKIDGLSNLTITLWLNQRATPAASDRLVSKFFSAGTNGTGFDLRFSNVGSTGTFSLSFFEMRNQPLSGLPTVTSSLMSSPTNSWTFLAVTYDGSKVRFWRGATNAPVAQVGTDQTPPSGFATPSNTTADVRVGGTAAVTTDRTPPAYFDDVRIYDVALSSSELESVRNENLGAPPVILQQPSNQTAFAGGDATFSVYASGTPPLAYQWFLETNALASGTNAWLTLTNVSAAQTGSYAVVVSNAYGSITSSTAVLTVTLPPPLTVTRAAAASSRLGLVIDFSRPVTDEATNAANYVLSGGLTVSGATLDATTLSNVTLTTSLQIPYSNYTVSVTGVHDRLNGDPIVSNEAAFAAWGWYGPAYNVPEAADYTLLYALGLPSSAAYNSNAVPYLIDHRSWVTNFSRVAYYLELQPSNGTPQFIWVAMDAFSQDPAQLGIPTPASGAFFQQPVTNMTVRSSLPAIATGTNLAGGNIEFWPGDYATTNVAAVPGAGDSTCDWGDAPLPGNGHGSMQIHHGAAAQVLLAFNGWGNGGGPADLGIGNNTGNAHADWTLMGNASSYPVKRLMVFVLPKTNRPAVEADLVVYGGTSGGAIAAVQAARMGKRVVLLCCDNHIGGLSSGGLGWTDIGSHGNGYVGGLAREFYQRNGARYGQAVQFNLEPHAAEQIFGELLAEEGVRVHFNARLAGVSNAAQRISQITMDDGAVYTGKMFLDATYEGDLMAMAGVSFTVGREGSAAYGESLAGVRTPSAGGYNVDPYVVPGNPASGLLPLVQPGTNGPVGSADQLVQAYNFRMAFSKTATNRLPLLPPPDYGEAPFELLGRYLDARVAKDGSVVLGQLLTDNRPFAAAKYDINNNGDVSTDFVAGSWTWPTSSLPARAAVRQAHEDYTRGFFAYLATSPRVPASVRAAMQTWGLCKDEFLDTGGWPHALYVREARRMVGDYVMLQQDCTGSRIATDSVGLAAYTMDSHIVQRLALSGLAQREGGFGTAVPATYPVSYRSIIPRAGECGNLLCTFALSASHVAFSSIRMEPVFMILSQSAGTAASFAIDDDVAVQQLDYAKLNLQLQADGQVLGSATDLAEGVVVDDADATGVVISGAWSGSTSIAGFWGSGYLHDGNAGKGTKSVTFTPDLPSNGTYDVYLRWTADGNRATNVPVDVLHPGGSHTVVVNQQINGSAWRKIFTTNFNAGTGASVVLRTDETAGFVVADAVRFLAAGTPPCTVQVVPTIPLAAENGNTPARVTFVRTGDASEALALAYSLGGAASNGLDYSASPVSLALAAGAVSTSLLLTALGDALAEGEEPVIVGVLGGTNYLVGALDSATVTIADAAPPPRAEMQAMSFATNGLVIRFSGASNLTYGVERAPDLFGAWTNIATLTGSPAGVQFRDTNLPPGRAFYRTTVP